jgi:hypothetical protein
VLLDVGALQTLGFSDQLIADTMAWLDETSTALANVDVGDVSQHVFGNAPASLGCANDAVLARDKVVSSLNDMSAGLLGYRTGLDQLQRRTTDTEDTVQVDLQKTLNAVDSCNTPTIASPSACTLPTPNDGGHR